MAIHFENQNIQLVIVPARNTLEQPAVNRPSLEVLIAKCDPTAPIPSKDAEWEMLRSVGHELL